MKIISLIISLIFLSGCNSSSILDFIDKNVKEHLEYGGEKVLPPPPKYPEPSDEQLSRWERLFFEMQ